MPEGPGPRRDLESTRLVSWITFPRSQDIRGLKGTGMGASVFTCLPVLMLFDLFSHFVFIFGLFLKIFASKTFIKVIHTYKK